ncbi:DUF805 domain-containing protein [Streptomyces sp. H39-S7]|uniref:DUF805 domain-containing protein n=1 Tax=Streptomyces sp. H39-S7 TaxID=3004357 RepID=UPI0022AF59DF|nr:DUF805 domain-containing protein [Streptomyces sp. H39-S7]MCZ4125923.1 DUF805 domain-containing protein [Streptomyces sp. H39-S7]
MNAYFDVLKQYTNFSGRARRREFWMYTLIGTIIAIVLRVLDAIAGTDPWIALLFSLATLLPTLAVTARRLHDTNRSGWFILLSLIPCVGGIILIVFLATDSAPGANQYGANPKDGHAGYTDGPPFTPAGPQG